MRGVDTDPMAWQLVIQRFVKCTIEKLGLPLKDLMQIDLKLESY